jgi:hypothetical protein
MRLNSPCADKCFLEDFNVCFSLHDDKTCIPYQKKTSLQTQKHLFENSDENIAKAANISAIQCIFSATIH